MIFLLYLTITRIIYAYKQRKYYTFYTHSHLCFFYCLFVWQKSNFLIIYSGISVLDSVLVLSFSMQHSALFKHRHTTIFFVSFLSFLTFHLFKGIFSASFLSPFLLKALIVL